MARVLPDEGVPKSLAGQLTNAGHSVERVVEAGLGGASDDAVFAYAQQRESVVITRDPGFVDAGRLPLHHGGLIVIRFPNEIKAATVNDEVMRFVTDEFSLDDMSGRLVVLEPGGRARWREEAPA